MALISSIPSFFIDLLATSLTIDIALVPTLIAFSLTFEESLEIKLILSSLLLVLLLLAFNKSASLNGLVVKVFSLLASGISSKEEEEIKDTENKFLKPRLVSNSENKNIRNDSLMQQKTKQADLEDFLSKEINDSLQENRSKPTSDKKINGSDFFIPKEEVVPNIEKTSTTNPFKEADLLNANGNNTNSIDDSVSLISRLSSNVKEKAINVGSKAISMVSEVANKSLENKFMKKDEEEDIKTNEFNAKERVEPSFTSLDKNEENSLNVIDNKTTMQDTNYNNIPSFLKRNRD